VRRSEHPDILYSVAQASADIGGGTTCTVVKGESVTLTKSRIKEVNTIRQYRAVEQRKICRSQKEHFSETPRGRPDELNLLSQCQHTVIQLGCKAVSNWA